MKPHELKAVRLAKGWSQLRAAPRLGVSQAYLAMLESGKRRLTPALQRRAMNLYRLPPTFLPPGQRTSHAWNAEAFAKHLAALGYPGFAYLRPAVRQKKNPGEVLLAALEKNQLEPRLVEALPWLLLQYWNVDRPWLVREAKLRDLQNRLGFVVSLARRLAERASGSDERVRALRDLEAELDRSRLVREDTLCNASLPEPERRWLLQYRPEEAKRWNLLSDWRPEHLSYAA